MTALNVADCQQAWNDLNIQTSVAELETLFNQAGYTNDLNSIASNLESQGGGFDQFGTALLTFKMTHWASVLKKMHQLTGGPEWLNRGEDLVDWFFARTDEALWANSPNSYQNLPLTAGSVPLVPYTECAGLPLGWNVNTPWCGWSRIFTVNLSGTNTRFVRAEPLLDGGIATEILCLIKYFAECGHTVDPGKLNSWLDQLECIMDGWKANWEYNRQLTINPDCTPVSTGVVLAGQFYLSSDNCGQTFVDPIALNQGAIILSAMVLLNECDSTRCLDAKSMATAFISDINDYYFNSVGGWYYRLNCAAFEPAEDLGHFYITGKFLETAFSCGLVDQAFIDRFQNGLKNNSYQGNGDWTWLNDGTFVNAGTQPNGQNTNAQGFASGPTDSAIGGNCQLGKTASAIANLPNHTCETELAATIRLLESKGTALNNNENIEGIACLLISACREEDEPIDSCLSCENSLIQNVTVSADPTPYQFTTVDDLGQPITTTPTITPAVDITSQGNGQWTVFLSPTGQNQTYTIETGCGSCTFTALAEDECGEGSIVTTTVGGGVDELCHDLNDPNAEICHDLNVRPDNRVITRRPYSPKTCNQICCPDGGLDTVLLYCNWCTITGAVVEATNGTEISIPRMACECEDGVFWQFVNNTKYSVTLPEQDSFDSVVLSGHDLCKAGATVKIWADGALQPLMSHTGSQAIIGQEKPNKHGIDCGCSDTAIYLEKCKPGSKVDVEIQSSGIRRIDNIFIGQSLEIDLETGAQDSWFGSSNETEHKTNSFGFFPWTLKKATKQVDIELTQIDTDFVDYELSDLVKYGTHYPIYYALSRTTHPNKIARAVIRLNDLDPAIFDSNPCRQSLSIPLELFINGC